MDGRRVFIFFLLMFFLLTAPDPHSPISLSKQERQRQLVEKQHILTLLKHTTYGDFNITAGKWLPLTGLMVEDGFAWDLLPVVQDKAKQQLLSVLPDFGTFTNSDAPGLNITELSLPVYRNVTGKLRGDWVRWNRAGAESVHPVRLVPLPARQDNSSVFFEHNVTADHGSFFLVLEEGNGEVIGLNGPLVREIKADLVVQSDQQFWGETWVIPLFGVHFPGAGAITLSTTSGKFAGLTALPHFTLTKDSFELSRCLLNRSLSEASLEPDSTGATSFPWSTIRNGSSLARFSPPKCEYIVYLQQHLVSLQGKHSQVETLEMIEGELRFPRGIPIPDPPPMVMSAVVFSPDCGFVLETKGSAHSTFNDGEHLIGPKQEEYRRYADRFVTIITSILAFQISLLLKQMKDEPIPSTRSRVSFFTIAAMSMGDTFIMAFVLVELYSEASFLLLTASSFLAFFSVSFVSMKFQIEIWVTQAAERGMNSNRDISLTSVGVSPNLPLPATTSRPVNEQPPLTASSASASQGDAALGVPSETVQAGHNSRIDASSMYSRFYLFLFFLLFFSAWTLFWPYRLRQIYGTMLSFIYFSFWLPQIFRNVLRNCRKALRWDFVIGQSVLRIFPFLYFFLIPRNVLFIEARPTMVFALVTWVWIQVCFLTSQYILGPRFFVPKNWVTPSYDYHPVLYDSSRALGEGPEPSGALPITSLRVEQREASIEAESDNKRADQNRKRVFDCAICMQGIEVLILSTCAINGRSRSNIAEGATSLLSRRTYMVTPCQHIFHSTCLETWMRLRLQCPICREAIPPA